MLALSTALILPLGGCEMFNGDDDDDDDNGRTSADIRTAGDLPSNADRVAQSGKGQNVSFTATKDGTVYVSDRDSDRVIYVGSIRDGHRLQIDADKGEVINNGVTVDRDVKSDGRYNVHFVPN
jgi:hypothetical protein